jgi:hypothetical protein
MRRGLSRAFEISIEQVPARAGEYIDFWPSLHCELVLMS